MVSIDRPLDLCAMPDPQQAPARHFAVASGLCATPTLIRHEGSEHGIELEITPAGARALFGRPAAELAATVVPLDAVLGPMAGEVLDRVGSAPTWPDRFAVLDEVLGRAIGELPPPPPELVFAWDRLVSSAGTADIGSVARDVGWSRRNLSERFRREYGQPPKVMGRVMRFERARGLLSRADRPPLAQVAAITGYADQSHLTREWRELTGTTPAAWMSDEQFPFVQDDRGERQAV